MKWIPENNRPSSTMFICPHCDKKVYYLHGASAKSHDNGKHKECLYKICPWCGEPVAAYIGGSTSTAKTSCMECEYHDFIIAVGKPIVLQCELCYECCYLTKETMNKIPDYCPLKATNNESNGEKENE